VRLFKFRALVDIDLADASIPVRAYHSGTRALTVHAWRIGEPARDKYFPAMLTWDDKRDLLPGDHAVVTITVVDQEAPDYLDAGQSFTLWGGGSGHGVISRRVFTDGIPS
jgi:hypothetical protein